MKKLLILFFLLSATPRVYAAEPACIFADKLNALQKFVTDNQYNESLLAIQQEVSLRREILADVIHCTRRDAETIRGKLEKADLPDDIKTVREYLLVSLAQDLAHYDAVEHSLPDLGIRGLKDAARQLNAWREDNEANLLITINNLLIWSANEDLIRTGEIRLTQIRSTVRSLTALIENEEAGAALLKAEESFTKAKEAHQEAREIVKKYPLPRDPLPSIKATLESLAVTYEQFFVIADEINKLVPRH